ncbi:MAG: J domain-containing protein [Lachnospiraceae bacterium]|nr:J domain-containing protein [Lachnospiraceae bacterium]
MKKNSGHGNRDIIADRNGSAVGDKYIFEILEIEPTCDAKKINDAYTDVMKKYQKKYRPEEYLEKWKEIHDAYILALGLAREESLRDERVEMPEPIEELSGEQQNRQKDVEEAGKIRSASKAQGRKHDFVDGARTLVRAAGWLLVVLLSGSGLYLRIVRYTGGTAQQRQRQYEQSIEKAERDREIIEEMQRISEQQDKIKEELSRSIELVGLGDTREKMISLYGEPDALQEDPESKNYEKAVYHLYDVDMTITLYMDVILNVHYETSQDKSKGE